MPPETPSAPRPSRGPAALAPVGLDAGTLTEAYAAVDIQLAPEATLLDASVHEVVAESPLRRAGREAAVAAAATEVIALTRETTAGWLAAAARTAEAGVARAVADDSRVEAVDASAWGQWQALAQTALSSLATAQRVVTTHALARFEREAEAEEWIELLAELRECELTVSRQARSLQHSCDRIDQVRRRVVAARRRDHAERSRRARTGRFIGRESCRRRSVR